MEEHTFLNSPHAALRDLGASLLGAWDHENLHNVYTRIYRILPKEFRGELLSPDVASSLSVHRLRGHVLHQYGLVNNNIHTVVDYLSLPGINQIGNPIGACDLEVGYEDGGPDGETSARCLLADYAGTGIMANIDFALKDDLTCVKDQGRRGTCVAHAAVAATETLAMVDSGVAENLSEQDLYFEGETEVDTFMNSYLEGLSTSAVLEHMEATNYDIQFEEEWNYNRSPNRASPVQFGVAPIGAVPTYPNSCSANYWGEMCTDFASQGVTTFSGVLLGTASRPSVPANGAESIDNVAVLPIDATFADLHIAVAKIFLAGDVPMVLSTAVTLGFSTPLIGGYVNYVPNGAVTGNHALALVGFVDNADLPSGAPQATEDGYFVAKNSWGTGFADCGFIYIDQAYVRNHALYLSTFELN